MLIVQDNGKVNVEIKDFVFNVAYGTPITVSLDNVTQSKIIFYARDSREAISNSQRHELEIDWLKAGNTYTFIADQDGRTGGSCYYDSASNSIKIQNAYYSMNVAYVFCD